MLRRISSAALARVRQDVSALEPYVQRELPRELLERKLASGAKLPPEIRAHYERLLAGPPEGVVLEPALDLHKAWHGIHFLLTAEATGGAPPLAWAVLGASEQNLGEDLGYGPATYLSPAQVQEVSSALGALSLDELRRRYDPQKMTELGIYPSEIWRRADSFDWLLQFYEPLPAYYAEAAERESAMLIWLS